MGGRRLPHVLRLFCIHCDLTARLLVDELKSVAERFSLSDRSASCKLSGDDALKRNSVTSASVARAHPLGQRGNWRSKGRVQNFAAVTVAWFPKMGSNKIKCRQRKFQSDKNCYRVRSMVFDSKATILPQDLDYVILVKSPLMGHCVREDLWKVCSEVPLMLATGFWLQLLWQFPAKYTNYLMEKNVQDKNMFQNSNFDFVNLEQNITKTSFVKELFGEFLSVFEFGLRAFYRGMKTHWRPQPETGTGSRTSSVLLFWPVFFLCELLELKRKSMWYHSTTRAHDCCESGSHWVALFLFFGKHQETSLKLGHFWSLRKTRKN